MKMTIEQVKADIKSGKCTRIYYSAHTLWWTHLDSDVEEATKMGRIARDKQHEMYLERKDISHAERTRYSNLVEMTKKSAVTIPLDPSGSPLYQIDEKVELMKWITAAEEKPEHFGQHKLDAFMMSHHQNCEGKCFSKWDGYNMLITTKNN